MGGGERGTVLSQGCAMGLEALFHSSGVALMKDCLPPPFVMLKGPETVPYGILKRGGLHTQAKELQTGAL